MQRIPRRDFLKTGAIASSGLLLAGETALASAASPSNIPGKIRGVNLGGWLVLEKWMVPGVYRDTDAPDEYELCRVLGSQAKPRLDRHRETFITPDDFRWIKACGLNAVRLPVGYWALEAPAPFIEARRFVDFAFEQAQEAGLKLLLDLHGAPGSQNGWDHSGRSGQIGWHKDPKNIQETLQVLEGFSERYGKHPALLGIGLLNEPRQEIPVEILKTFYSDAYARIRKHAASGVAVVLHDSFRPFAWKNFMTGPGFENVLLDTHLYQCFTDDDKKRTAQQQIAFALTDRKTQIDQMQQTELPTVVGEWSLGLPGQTWRNESPFQREVIKRSYGDAQLMSYEDARGWFYWSYKLEHPSDWSFRDCVESGWLPRKYDLAG